MPSQTSIVNETVSIVIPVYNAERWVGEAISSIANQKHVGEVLLVEDGSTDNSYEVCMEFASKMPRVNILRHENGRNRVLRLFLSSVPRNR